MKTGTNTRHLCIPNRLQNNDILHQIELRQNAQNYDAQMGNAFILSAYNIAICKRCKMRERERKRGKNTTERTKYCFIPEQCAVVVVVVIVDAQASRAQRIKSIFGVKFAYKRISAFRQVCWASVSVCASVSSSSYVWTVLPTVWGGRPSCVWTLFDAHLTASQSISFLICVWCTLHTALPSRKWATKGEESMPQQRMRERKRSQVSGSNNNKSTI